MSWDPYLDLEHGVLRNRLGISDHDELRVAEADYTSVRLAQLVRHGLPGAYDLAHLQAFHRHIFGDVYDWAGELRTVPIGKGASLFCHPDHIEADAAELFAWLARADHLYGLARPTFLDALAELAADLNALHPFREGNGRAQRAFLGQLAREAGRPIRWTLLRAEENVAAAKAAQAEDLAPLRALLDRLVAPET